MSSNIKEKIRRSDDLLIKADKTSNFYRMKPENYEELLHNNITKTYKKIDDSLATSIEKKSKNIAENLGLDDRIETTGKKEPFITLKDHKPNFDTNPKCRLINPAKTENWKNKQTDTGQDKQTNDRENEYQTLEKHETAHRVVQSIRNKPAHRFISFDVVEFYPSITEELLIKALDYASQFDKITQEERDIIIYAKRTCLYNDGATLFSP